jgi:hypothetical protein
MNNDNLNSILSDLAENAKPAAQIDLWPGLEKSLIASDGQSKQGKSIMNRTPVLRWTAFAALTVLVAFGIFLITPQGQTFAQELVKYFMTVSQRSLPPVPISIPVPTYTLEAGLVPQPTISTDLQNCGETISPISSTFICQLQDAQAQLDFVVKSFPARYVQVPFTSMWFDPERHSILMVFRDQQAVYTLAQGLGDFPEDSPGYAVFQEAVQPVQVGEYQAEYARGAFIFTEDKGMVWEPGEPDYQLRWKENDHWYAFALSAQQFADLEPAELQAKMIQIAENLVSLDQGADQLTAGDQPSIKDSAGFTIKEPGLLPVGFRQVADGSWSNLTTALRVGMRYDYMVDGQWVNSLTLDQMLIPADDQTLRREYALLYQNQTLVNGQWVNTNTDEEVQINGVTGYYLEGGESDTCALYWRDDEREYLLIYHWTADFGGRLDKETLIAIAESLK